MVDDLYASGVLDKNVHSRLVADIVRIAASAGIQPKWISTPLAAVCGAEERTWVTRFRFHPGEGTAGLCFVGRDDKLCVPDRMAAICGALTRNFVFAKVVPLSSWIGLLGEGQDADASCVLVPTFFVERARGGHQAEWRISLLLEALLGRYSQGRQTVLYVSSMDLLAKEYGMMFVRLIQRAYTRVDVA
jgi:hypothetical protein